MWLAAGAAGFGGYVIWSNKEFYRKEHLTTPHGQLGAAVLSFFLVYPLFASILLTPDSGILRTNKTVRTIHKYSGRFLLAMSLVTSALGVSCAFVIRKLLNSSDCI